MDKITFLSNFNNLQGLAGLLFGCCFIVVTTSLPPVFDDYFDEDVKVSSISVMLYKTLLLSDSGRVPGGCHRSLSPAIHSSDQQDLGSY